MPTINNIQPGQTVQMTGNIPALGPGQNCCAVPWTAVCGTETFSGTNTVCVSTQAIGVASELITCDSVRLQKACDYEQIYFDYVDGIHARLKMNWANFFGSRGSPTANEMYFWKNPYESMTRMLVLAKSKGLQSHVDKYSDLLMDALRSIMPRMFDGADAANTGSGSKYQNNGTRPVPETRYNYLSISRALAWVGYAIFMLRKCGNITAADEAFFQASIPRLKIMADWLADQLPLLCVWSSGGFGHMPSHLVAGMCFLEENGGYSYPAAQTCLTTLINEIDSRNGDAGSDLSHNMDTLGNLRIIRDKQICGGSILPLVTSDLIVEIGDAQAALINGGGSCVGGLCDSLPDHIGVHALAACSNGIDALIPPANISEFPLVANTSNAIAFSIQVATLADAAGGYAMRKDNEVC